MKRFWLALIAVAAARAQLTTEEKLLDLQSLAALYAKQYAPYEWKRDALKVDLLNLGPWMERARRTKDDLEFYEVLSSYVASLNDLHTVYLLPSDFIAFLGFSVDLYDGRPLIDQISRLQLPVRDYPFDIGDELVSIDGRTSAEWLAEFARFSAFANKRSTDRFNAIFLTFREQDLYPRAHEIGDRARVVIRRRSGEVENYSIPWIKFGTPVTTIGPVPAPRLTSTNNRVDEPGIEGLEDDTPNFLKRWWRLQNAHRAETPGMRRAGLDLAALRGFGAIAPVWNRPAGFVQRLGRPSDFFFSGTYQAQGKRIGYLRIPSFQPALSSAVINFAIRQFDAEIAFLRENTDALVLDVMRNPGGIPCYVEELARRVIPTPFEGLRQEVRPTREWILEYASVLEEARLFGVDTWIVVLLEEIVKQLQSAYRENRGRTGSLPVCGITFDRDPVRDRDGKVIAYDKPMLVLIDEFSTSGGEMLPALIQDAGRAPLFGVRTAGGGGVVSAFATPVGFYSEGFATATQSLIVRRRPVVTPDFPTSSYIENIGVRPEIPGDYMTEENLRTNGRAFVDAFTEAVLQLIR
ncbi:MAG: S41 family peptidase [Bryobacteraceae bacterium]